MIKKEESWLSKELFLKLGLVFFITQIIGLFVAHILFIQGLQQAPFAEDINDPINALFLFIQIIIMTIIILILLKYKKQRNFLWLIEAMAVFVTSLIVISALLYPLYNILPFIADIIALVFAISIVIYRQKNRKNKFFRNFVSMISIAGAGAFIGISLGLIPILFFIIALAIYDIIAVFGTKHMVTLGKSVVKNNFAFTVFLPTKKHSFELGNGDLVIPLMTASSIYANGLFFNNGLVALLVLGASFIGLIISIYLVSVKKFAMPALPPQTLLMLIVIGASILIGL